MPSPHPPRLRAAALVLALGLSGCSTSSTRTSSAPSTPERNQIGTGAAVAVEPQPWVATVRPATRARAVPPARGPVAPFGLPVSRGLTVTLTFDDGPWPEATPQVLQLLRQNHAPAVFCLIGRLASKYPAMVRQEVASGGKLCDHSRDHDLHAGDQSPVYQQSEVADGLQMIRAASGNSPVGYYRQPGGLWDSTVVKQTWALHLTALRWTDDPRDWSRPSVGQIIARVLHRLTPGGVILLHDGGGDRSHTVAALRWLLPHLRARGWHFVLPSAGQAPLSFASSPQ